MKKELVFSKPNKKQALFFKARKKYIAYGGARGGGKSWAVRVKAILMAIRYPGIKIMIVRKSYPELMNNHVNEMRAILLGIARYNNTDKALRFTNGSMIKFQYCERDSDLDRMQGLEIDVLFIDEATQITEDQFRKMEACVRGVNNFPKRVYLTCNPGGVGHGWVKRLFVTRKFKKNENPEDYVFIQAKVEDNKALMKTQPEYVQQLKNLPVKLQKAWLEGSWDIFEGQFFEEFIDNPEGYQTRRFSHVIEPFRIPKSWNIYRSYDWGYAKPFSVGWWAVDPEDTLYRIRELYGCTENPNEGVKWSSDVQFQKVREIEAADPNLAGRSIVGVADPSIWDGSKGVSVFDTACKYGIFFEKAENARIPGWMQVHYRLQFDEYGHAGLYCFNTCPAFIRTMPLMCHDKTNVEDLDTDLEDHVMDETRYMCMARPVVPVEPAVQKEIADDPLNMIADAAKKRR